MRVLCWQAYIFHEGHLQTQLAGQVSSQEERHDLQTALAPEAVNTTEARALAQGAVQLKAQAQNFQVHSTLPISSRLQSAEGSVDERDVNIAGKGCIIQSKYDCIPSV